MKFDSICVLENATYQLSNIIKSYDIDLSRKNDRLQEMIEVFIDKRR